MSSFERIVLLLSIIGRGKRKPYLEMLNSKNIQFHMQMIGYGTAPSEMMDIFGLGTNNKDVIFSFASADTVASFALDLGKTFDSSPKYGGLAMVLPLSAINRISAELIRKRNPNANEKEGEEMKNENKYHLIAVAVNQGYTDEVMQTAKHAGATGGTILRARLADSKLLEQLGDVQEEKEIVLIFASSINSNEILEAVNQACGLRTPAQGVVCAIPVEKAFKI